MNESKEHQAGLFARHLSGVARAAQGLELLAISIVVQHVLVLTMIVSIRLVVSWWFSFDVEQPQPLQAEASAHGAADAR
jgi:uncharacterized protein (DUF983 family)